MLHTWPTLTLPLSSTEADVKLPALGVAVIVMKPPPPGAALAMLETPRGFVGLLVRPNSARLLAAP
jgi:hypothetical protein